MAGDIPSQIEYEHLLSHTFPGFFSAITLFMLIDVWTNNNNLTYSILNDINGLVTFIGFVLLIGTILGIIIDYIHHWLIESLIFDKYDEVQLWIVRFNKFVVNSDKRHHFEDNENIIFYYFLKEIGPDAINYILHLRKAKYCYSEFYSNIFISLIPFSLVIPFYLLKVFQIPWHLGISLSIICLILSCISLASSYQAYINFNKSLYYLVRGYLEKNYCKGVALWQ